MANKKKVKVPAKTAAASAGAVPAPEEGEQTPALKDQNGVGSGNGGDGVPSGDGGDGVPSGGGGIGS
jgi:transcription elongation factor